MAFANRSGYVLRDCGANWRMDNFHDRTKTNPSNRSFLADPGFCYYFWFGAFYRQA